MTVVFLDAKGVCQAIQSCSRYAKCIRMGKSGLAKQYGKLCIVVQDNDLCSLYNELLLSLYEHLVRLNDSRCGCVNYPMLHERTLD